MELDSQPGFLGTSIQFAEQQIKLLEQQYATKQAESARELIEQGFMDTDYEGSDGEYDETGSEYDYTESESEDEFELDLIAKLREKELESDISIGHESTIGYDTGSGTGSSFHIPCSPSSDVSTPDDRASDIMWDLEDDHGDAAKYTEWESREPLSPGALDEEVVVEHVFHYLDTYLSANEEEEIVIDVDCTIWTVYDEDNQCQHIVDGKPVVNRGTAISSF